MTDDLLLTEDSVAPEAETASGAERVIGDEGLNVEVEGPLAPPNDDDTSEDEDFGEDDEPEEPDEE